MHRFRGHNRGVCASWSWFSSSFIANKKKALLWGGVLQHLLWFCLTAFVGALAMLDGGGAVSGGGWPVPPWCPHGGGASSAPLFPYVRSSSKYCSRLSWLLTCVTAHWASPELSLEPHTLPGAKSKSQKLLKPKSVWCQSVHCQSPLSLLLRPWVDKKAVVGQMLEMATNWCFVVCIFFWASLGVLDLATLQVWEFPDKTLAPEVCVWCLCGPMAIVGIHHWVEPYCCCPWCDTSPEQWF